MTTAPMNRIFLASIVGFTMSVGALAQNPVLPVDALIPAADASSPGFVVRTVQAPAGLPLDNNFLRAVRQLNGTLDDVENIASPGPNPDGSFHVTEVDFATQLELGPQGRFFGDQQFPGTEAGVQTLFSTEVITYLNLPAGTI